MDPHHEVENGMDLSASRACDATRKGAQAFTRLLHLADDRQALDSHLNPAR